MRRLLVPAVCGVTVVAASWAVIASTSTGGAVAPLAGDAVETAGQSQIDVTPDVRPPKLSIDEARAAGQFPERKSPRVLPADFDRRMYERGGVPRANYLNTVEPGRVQQAAEATATTPKLVLSASPGEVTVGGQGELAVRFVVPEGGQLMDAAPVTFTSYAGGTFSNGRGSITVASQDGTALVTWTATAGVTEDVAIVASSPVASGRAHFSMIVTPAPAPGDADPAAEAE